EKAVYASAQYHDLLDLSDIAGHIAEHNSPFSKGVILGILTDMVACLRENLLLGNKIQLGDLGAFYVTLKCDGAESTEAFSTSLIKKVYVRWAASNELKSLLNDASFRQVATRELQAQSRKEMRDTIDEDLGVATGNNGNENGNGGDDGVTE
ncbi:MAG: hypothetical protein IK084_00960, partial [Bacteroidaceae bacterium]|nr:hypothetical protein [Bacteroidaceae bacterium]